MNQRTYNIDSKVVPLYRFNLVQVVDSKVNLKQEAIILESIYHDSQKPFINNKEADLAYLAASYGLKYGAALAAIDCNRLFVPPGEFDLGLLVPYMPTSARVFNAWESESEELLILDPSIVDFGNTAPMQYIYLPDKMEPVFQFIVELIDNADGTQVNQYLYQVPNADKNQWFNNLYDQISAGLASDFPSWEFAQSDTCIGISTVGNDFTIRVPVIQYFPDFREHYLLTLEKI